VKDCQARVENHVSAQPPQFAKQGWRRNTIK